MLRRFLVVAFVLAALAVVLVPSAAAQGVTWTGSYYNTNDLTGGVVMTRSDGSIAFNWGTGSPGAGINTNGFSVRWGTDIHLDAGTYRFVALADDKVRVWVDYSRTPLIDTFASPSVGQAVTRDITLQSGTHHIQVDYAEETGDAYVFVSFTRADGTGGGQQVPVPQQPQVITTPITGGLWTGQYFANRDLAGSPTLIQSELDITHDWANGSPTASIPADNFSARWSSIQQLAGGTYQVRVNADDGVRVFVDGVAIINEWHQATDQFYIANLNLGAGQHTFLVEYYEAGGLARITFQLLQTTVVNPVPPVVVPQPQQPQVPSPTGTTATITAGRLNVRAEPNPFTGRIVTIVSRGDVFPVLGYNSDNTWVQLNVRGTVGWVNRGFVTISGASVSQPLPTVVPPPSTSPTGFTVIASPYAVNIRQGPGVAFGVLGVLPRNQTAPVLARTSDGFWWYITYNGVTGWVSTSFAQLMQSNADLSRIPVR